MAVLTGLFASDVLVTLPKPTMAEVIPDTVPVNIGEASGAFKSKAVCKPLVLAIDKAPSAIAVALPTLVTGPVKFALVVTVAALPEILPTMVEEKVFTPAIV